MHQSLSRGLALSIFFAASAASASTFQLQGQLNGGYFTAKPTNGEATTRTGYQIHAGASGQWSSEGSRWVLLAGLTYFTQSVNYTINTTGQSVTVKTNAFALEFSPLYSLTSHWRLGPMAQLLVGTDLSFPEPFKASGSALLAGLQVGYVPTTPRILPFAQFQTGVTVSNNTAYIATAGVRIAFGKLPETHASTEAQPQEVEPTPTPQAAPAPREGKKQTSKKKKKKGAPDVVIELDDTKVQFMDSGSLDANSAVFLSKIGRYLGHGSDQWDKLEVVYRIQGSGRVKQNRARAEEHAQAIADALVDAGAPEMQMRAHGEASKEVDDSRSWAELRFSGVRSDSLQSDLEKLKATSP